MTFLPAQARNNRLRWRAAAAIAALPLAIVPAAARTQDDCRAIRALTNADGRAFADVSLRFAGPYLFNLRAGAADALPETPDHCDFDAYTGSVTISCRWPTHYDPQNEALYDDLFKAFGECLPGLTPPAGPVAYGDTKASRSSVSSIATPGGKTEIDLKLIDSTAEVGSYVQLSIDYEADTP